MTNAEQIAQLKANSTRYITATIRTTYGGFVITGQIQYNDKDTKGVVMTQNDDAVAPDMQRALTMTANYFNTGNFDGIDQSVAAAQPSLFAGATPTNSGGSVI